MRAPRPPARPAHIAVARSTAALYDETVIVSRQERDRQEDLLLAPYAVREAASRGRKIAEPRHDYRAEFQRDRDRIIHSRAFRRLEYKTQVFVNGTADHYRTRLTHTIEMAAVARTMARALRANEDLAEAIALAHDLGHSPFGHSGEHALDELMQDAGGFDHNLQGLRCVELLEYRYPDFTGLNLAWEVRAGLLKHQAAAPGAQLDGHPLGPRQQIEAQLADVADDITYLAHDADDGLEAGLLTEARLQSTELWCLAARRAAAEFTAIPPERRLALAIRCLLNLLVEDVLQTSAGRLDRYRPAAPEDVMHCTEPIVSLSSALSPQVAAFKEFLFKNMYWHPAVLDANHAAVRMMRRLFLHYTRHPEVMGAKALARLPREGLWRTVCDYVAGMTDRYALDEYRRFGLEQEKIDLRPET
ncbi:MAG: deoxyguanosinetriphosphate triphosphohydrolase [Kiritimatiellaeota bacterium]|nr:deoxyguanosinetriphosphate triphosphohydrolase [Kiritimatiellota bacterium]